MAAWAACSPDRCFRGAGSSIRSLAFQEGNKWRLFDGQNVITATIEDKEFLQSVDANERSFRKGDVLICEVRTVQRQGLAGLTTEHTVLRVIDHKTAATQIALPLAPSAEPPPPRLQRQSRLGSFLTIRPDQLIERASSTS